MSVTAAGSACGWTSPRWTGTRLPASSRMPTRTSWTGEQRKRRQNARPGGTRSCSTAARPSGHERDDQDRDDVRDLDHRVDRGPGGVLVGIADGVARDRGLVGEGALAAERALLDEL